MRKLRTPKKPACRHAAFGTGLNRIEVDRTALAMIARMLSSEAKTDADRDRLEALAGEIERGRPV